MNVLVNWLISSLIVIVAAYILPGVHVESLVTALVVALVLGILNLLIRPLIILLTLPITLVTFGLFLVVINALMLLLTDAIVPGFTIDGFWWAVLYSILVTGINILLQRYKDDVASQEHRKLRQ
ncbi:MAG: phage holin family protein [Candidatus Levybacteria bacterium]|nr:phage holin family protein [Candidatus Levybacteria bacterium]